MNFAAKQRWVGIVWVCAHFILWSPLVPLCKENHSVNTSGLPRLMRPCVYSLLVHITHLLVPLLSPYLKGKPLVKGNLKWDMFPSPKLPGPQASGLICKVYALSMTLENQKLSYWTVPGLVKSLPGILQCSGFHAEDTKGKLLEQLSENRSMC